MHFNPTDRIPAACRASGRLRMNRGNLTGAVLAGGASKRMGQDKATLNVDGGALWQRQVRVLQEAGATAIGIVRRREQPALMLPPGIRLWHDAVTDAGPLAGLQAALTACDTDWLAVLATDMRNIDAGWFRWLRDSCREGSGAMARHSTGLFEPLAAIYPRGALAEVTARLEQDGPRSLQSLAETLIRNGRLASVPLAPAEAWRAASWNTPADIVPHR